MANTRASVDLADLKERVENARTDPLWKELSLSKKVRFLLKTYLDLLDQGTLPAEQLTKQAVFKPQPQTIAELVQQNYYQLLTDGKLEPEEVRRIADGGEPLNGELVIIAAILDLDEDELIDLRAHSFPHSKRKEPNGTH